MKVPNKRLPVAAGLAALAVVAAAGCSPKKDTAQATSGPRDWSGVWQMTGGLIFDPTTATDASRAEGSFGPGRLSRMAPPYNEVGQKLYDDKLKERAALIDDDPIANCQPFGFPRIVGGGPGPIEILVTPKVTFMIWQYYQQIRRIYMDAEHEAEDMRLPTYFGDSTGRWEGDTLVVETIDVRAGRYDRTGAPYSDKTTVVERWRKKDDKTLENQITVTDPEYLAKPWTVTRTYEKIGEPGTRVREFYCEGNRNPIVIGPDGKPRQSVLLSDGTPVH